MKRLNQFTIKHKPLWIVAALVVIAVLVALFAFPIPSRVDQTYSAVWWNPETGTLIDNGYVKIEGTKWTYLFQKEKPIILSKAAFSCWNRSETKPLAYVVYSKERAGESVTGNIPVLRSNVTAYDTADNGFQDATVYRDDTLTRGLMIPYGENADNYVIAFPAETLAEAISIYQAFGVG